MNALSIRSDVTGLAMKHARGLRKSGDRQAKKVGLASVFVSGVARHLFSPLLEQVGTLACGFIDKHTLRMADRAVWFQGAKATVEHDAMMPASPEAIAALLQDLDKLQASFIELRRSIHVLIAQFEGFNPDSRVAHALRRQNATLADFFESVEGFRWAVMEREADDAIRDGKVEMFDSVEDLFARLDA